MRDQSSISAFKSPVIHSTQKLKRFAAGRFLRCCLLVMLLSALAPHFNLASGNQKKEKFRGTVVHAGPKAITVKSQNNIYMVRTFNYTPQLEKKIHSKPPVSGKKVTVHYLRGTDLAIKVD
jgi:hypothetical protein